MTLAQIIRTALLQLGEDPEDVSEYEELFRAYANEGYEIAVDQFLKPREMRVMHTDRRGIAHLHDSDFSRIVGMPEAIRDGYRLPIPYDLLPDGRGIRTNARDKDLLAVVEIHMPPMERPQDEPALPAAYHHALADYVCYRHLCNGNLAKQQRGQTYLSHFMQAMGRMRPQGYGTVTRLQNLYASTELR